MKLSITEAARHLGISEAAVRNRLRRGSLRRSKEGRRVFVVLEGEAAKADTPAANQDRPNASNELGELLASKDREIDRLVAMLEGEKAERVQLLEALHREQSISMAAVPQKALPAPRRWRRLLGEAGDG